MIEIIGFLIVGIVLGVLMGLIPGIHPNLILLMYPVFAVLDGVGSLVLITSMAVTNSIVDFIPSVVFGAPDGGNEMSVLPGHELLMAGNGYDAIRSTVIGSFGSVLLVSLMIPLLIVFVPVAYEMARPFLYMILFGFLVYLVSVSKKRMMVLFCIVMAGLVGVMMNRLPVDSSMILFPVFSGLFGVSSLLVQLKTKSVVPEQTFSKSVVKLRSIIFGTLGGVFSGVVPAIGSSQIASIASVDESRSFLSTIGAITTSNILISLMALWLISKPRSGTAVLIGQLMTIGEAEFMIIAFTAITVCGIASLITLFLSKKILTWIGKINYGKISLVVVGMIGVLVFYFTGVYGMFLLGLCTVLGMTAIISNIRRGCLMAVLIIPSILFFIG